MDATTPLREMEILPGMRFYDKFAEEGFPHGTLYDLPPNRTLYSPESIGAYSCLVLVLEGNPQLSIIQHDNKKTRILV